MKSDNISLRRRHLMIAAVAGLAVPAGVFAASSNKDGTEFAERPLIVSGRITDANGKPVAGATVTAAPANATTDADGRFVFTTVADNARIDRPQSLYCRVSHSMHGTRDHRIDFSRASIQRDDAGAWRAAVGLRLT